MDSVATLPDDERRLLFTETAARMGVTPWVVEKDFWVCWVLKAVFSMPPDHPSILFKGGTSLSKVFRVIERFSEDIDLSISRHDLGFGGADDPESLTGNQRRRQVEAIDERVRGYVRDDLVPELKRRFATILRTDSTWELNFKDPAGVDLVFEYPAATDAAPTGGYARQSVLLEIGARSDHSPADSHRVTPYAGDHFPQYFQTPSCSVRVLDVGRTFWEKMTILHALHHGGPERANRELSRHYYDVHRLAVSPFGEAALDSLDLLQRVAIHKSVFYPAAWARYEEAVPGTLRLVPRPDTARVLAADYSAMRRAGFFYGEEPPSFDEILARLDLLETRINQRAPIG